MSSILDALRKLEKEKIHHDQISTAIASDILRTAPRRRRPAWLAPLLLFVAVLAGALLLLLLRAAPQDQQAVVVSSPIPAAPSALPQPNAQAPVVIAPVTVEPAASPADLPILTGIVYQQQPEARMAILNDLPVMEGMGVADYTLAQIRPDHVVLTRNGTSYTLRIPSER